MTNAEPPSTDSTTERAEKVAGQPPLIAVSEENLAALLRATSGAPEPEAEQSEAAAVTEVKAAPVEAVEQALATVAEPVASAPVETVASGTALFAAAKEHRAEILRARAVPKPAAVEQKEYPAASLPAETAPIQVTLPKSQPVIAAASIEVPTPSRNGLVIGGIGGALILMVGLFLLWPKGHPAKPAPVTVVAPKEIAPLQVLAEPLGNGLINVRWNAQSPPIAQARDGRLVITEHDKAPRTMALDAGN